ncbi:MAG: cell wall metabolism sensor histidine kinase WalK [Chloroflexi bacterium]|nr:cell wall metabolism sensor histidine kinase WalK [Chloroflexota bacterium]
MSRQVNPYLFVFSSALIALALAIIIIIGVMNPPARDVQLLILFMGSTAIITLFVAYVLQKLRLVERFPSLRLVIPVTIVLTASLLVFNVWVTARLMFISDHDFYLTTALLIFASLVATGFGTFLTAHITQRLSLLSNAAEVLAGGRFDERLEVKGSDEIAQLAKTFNMMTESLEKLDEQKQAIDQTRRDLIAWVSHDLRTPLSTIRVMLEAIQDGVVDDQMTRDRYINNSLKEIEHLSRLINDLFELAKLDTGHVEMHFQSASLRDLVSDTLSVMSAQAKYRGVNLTAKVSSNVDMVYMDAHKIQQVLYNLLDNAVRYTPEDGTVQLTVQLYGKDVQIDIHNSGVVIDNEQLPHIFDSFYRIEKSRKWEKDGRRSTGLGLTIAQRFVEAHKGRIWAESSQEKGTVFSFTLPVIV